VSARRGDARDLTLFINWLGRALVITLIGAVGSLASGRLLLGLGLLVAVVFDAWALIVMRNRQRALQGPAN